MDHGARHHLFVTSTIVTGMVRISDPRTRPERLHRGSFQIQMTRHSETEEQMGKQKQQMQGYHPCQGTDRGVVEIRDGKFYDGEPAWFPGARRPDGFYWF